MTEVVVLKESTSGRGVKNCQRLRDVINRRPLTVQNIDLRNRNKFDKSLQTPQTSTLKSTLLSFPRRLKLSKPILSNRNSSDIQHPEEFGEKEVGESIHEVPVKYFCFF